ncbi:MAG: 5-bromo-4-chloroindolyl phosphate hydrolysis family protein [Clostridia bacterium]|nr:5-bromo-4-chloroindolyl phosphate hydrolysis family protein [Clostridia bacterium]
MSKQIQEQEPDRAPIGKRYKYIPIKSARAIWASVFTWLACALIFPLYRIGWLIASAVITLTVGLIVKKTTKPETRRIEVPFSSGNPEVDDAVREFDRVAAVVESDRAAIADKYPSTAAHMGEIVSLLGKIAEDVAEDPSDLKRCRRFMNYYLPITVKLSDKYASIATKDNVANVVETRESIDTAFVQIESALRKQYDALFADDALDITTDVAVLDTMLKKDGLQSDLVDKD